MVDAHGVHFVALQLYRCAREWWKTFGRSRPVGSPPIKWDVFFSAFLHYFIPWSVREEIRLMFEDLRHSCMFMTKYEAFLCELSKHDMTIVPDET
ncbi:hypothetical protein R3W88_011838 [Solanum pinnatisectum]|uniref:Retrotransposon gag domain-containing protein n=1 Tax=Solanum pinnatisectum TaxID=50273 RepID=A0AAV9L9S6_9SOLN|nr:hypothetical protein R3W88_011838 [Solanum pinnatisectum]